MKLDKVLLIIQHPTLRQLYHTLLMTKQVEVIATESVSSAIMMLITHRFAAMIIYIGDDQNVDIQTFLKLRKYNKRWDYIPLLLLTHEAELYRQYLVPKDTLMNPLTVTIGQVVEKLLTTF